jgi:Tol biopolymer transport system component
MKNWRIAWVGAALLAALLAAGQKDQPAEVLLKAAQHKELVDGDLKAAIAQYQKALARAAANRAVAAKALLGMGQCHEKLGQAEARKLYQRLLREYADQTEPARVARERLATLQGGKPREMAIRLVVPSGKGVESNGSVSLDGRYLSYTDWGTGNLALLDLLTGEKRHLTKKGSWWTSDEYTQFSMISPDSRQVAYDWYNQRATFELRIIGIDGSQPRVVYTDTEGTKILQPHAWSPDGKQILMGIEKKDNAWELVLITVADGSTQVLKRLAGHKVLWSVRFSRDGRYIAYDRPQREGSLQRDIFLLDIKTGREIPLVEHPANDSLLDWTPDGKALFFASDRLGTNDAWLVAVSDGKAQGSPELIKRHFGDVVPLGFTQGGSFYYAFSRLRWNLYTARVDPESGKALLPVQLEPTRGLCFSADWSPDGKFLAYGCLGGGRVQRSIVIRSMETGEEREITPKLKNLWLRLRWSRDGRGLLAGGVDNGGQVGIFRIDPQTGDATLVAPLDTRCCTPGFDGSPDGKLLLYVSGQERHQQPRGLFVRDLEANRDTELARHPRMHYVAASPDGRQVVFSIEDEETQSIALMVLPATGGTPREIVRVKSGLVYSFTWTPDSRYVIYAERGKPPLWRVPAQGGPPQRFELTVPGPQWVSVHPDGQRLAIGTVQPHTEIWVMENFLSDREGSGR